MDKYFSKFFSQSYQIELDKLEAIRRRIIFNYCFIGFVVMIGFVFEAITWMLIGIVVILLFIFFYIRTFGISTELFHSKFNYLVQGAIGQFILPSASFDINRYLSLASIRKSFLISTDPTQFGGRNMIEHKSGDDWIRLSELDIYSKNRNDKGEQHQLTHFKGWAGLRTLPSQKFQPIIVADEELNIYLDGNEGIALPKSKDLLTWYENEEVFNKYFTPTVLMKILNFREKVKLPVFISMNEDQLCVAVSSENSFENASIWKKVKQKEELERIYNSQQFICELLVLLVP